MKFKFYTLREYKAVSPDETISRANNILETIGIKTKKIVFGKNGICNSVRLTFSDSEIENLEIGTNGKGLTESYATASAYGEMMERLENKMLLFHIKYASPKFFTHRPGYHKPFPYKLSFRYFPDEEYINISDKSLCEWGKKLLPESPIFEKYSPDATYDMPFVPFYNVFSDKVEELPYDMIRFAAGSTGLCAGNIPKEAILQGINEIFERYVLQQIYIYKPILSTITLQDIANDEMLITFQNLAKERHWRFIAKDCSLGKGFPVIGLLIIDDTNGKYTFRLGSDTCPQIALERCFSEIFQGTSITNSAFLPIDVSDNFNMDTEYKQNLLNGRGRFPSCIFLDGPKEIDKNKIEDSATISENFKSVIKWLKDKGYDLYIRDNSFLGFPAYHIYIPGLSDVNHQLFNIKKHLLPPIEYYQLPLEFRIDRLTANESKIFISKYSSTKEENINLVEFSWSKYSNLNKNLLLALIAFRSGETSEAYNFMNDFLLEQQNAGHQLGKYYYCIRDYFILTANNKSQQEIVDILNTLYGEEITKEVINDCFSKENIMMNIPLPKCFDCKNCKLNEECGYESLINAEAKIQKIQKQNIICQSDLKNLFIDINH